MNKIVSDGIQSSKQDVPMKSVEQGNATKGRAGKNAKRLSIVGATCGALLLGALSFGQLLDTNHHTPGAPGTGNVSTITANHKVDSAERAIIINIPGVERDKSIKQSNAGDIITSVRQVSTNPVGNTSPYVQTARDAAVRNGINPDLFVRQIQQESGFNPNAVSYVGAAGIAQFMPATAAEWGVNPYDPVSSLDGAARFMAHLNKYFGGNYTKAVAAYNAGAGNVEYAVNAGGGNWVAYLPAETQHYISVILG